MTLTAKTLVVLLCFVACASGIFIAPPVPDKSQPLQKTNAIPVRNHEISRRVWIVT